MEQRRFVRAPGLQGRVKIQKIAGDFLPFELFRASASAGEFAGSLRGIGERRTDGGSERGSGGRSKPSVLIVGVSDDAAGIRRDQRQARGHGLERSDAERLS